MHDRISILILTFLFKKKYSSKYDKKQNTESQSFTKNIIKF